MKFDRLPFPDGLVPLACPWCGELPVFERITVDNGTQWYRVLCVTADDARRVCPVYPSGALKREPVNAVAIWNGRKP